MDAMRITAVQNGKALAQALIQSRSAKEGADAAKSAAATATTALEASQRSFEIDQRPYLVADIPIFNNSSLVPLQAISANITFKNIGKTPAIKVVDNVELLPYHSTKKREDYVTFIEGAFAKVREKDIKARAEIRHVNRALEVGHDVAPGGTFFTTNHPDVIMSAQDLPLMLTESNDAGAVVLFFIGIISYTDAFSRNYETELCWFYFGSNIKTWHICDSHNLIR